MRNDLSQQLTASQKQAVFHSEGPLLVLAGPGSGKTRVITYRIAALVDSGVAPHNICAITFTNKAAEQMRQRAVALGAPGGAHISTFHSLCVRILRRYADDAGISPNFTIYAESDQAGCMKQAVKDCRLDTANFPPGRMLDAISALKNNLVDAEAFKTRADDFFSKTLAEIYLRYQQLLEERNSLDFDDLLMKAAFLLEASEQVRRELGNRFRFLLIDEYQDTNHAQYRIAKALVAAHGNICATGDPDQSIYRWRGADIRNILAFESDWPDATVVKLEENFRSTPDILRAADSLIACNRNRKQKKLLPTRPPGRPVEVEAFADEFEEAWAVAGRIGRLKTDGVPLNEIAVFYRVNAMSRLFEEAFIRSKVPYQIVRGVEFYNRKEIRDLLAYLKVLVNPSDEIALLRVINTPARGIGKVTIDRLRAHAARNNISLFQALRNLERIDSLSKATKSRLGAFFNLLEGLKTQMAGRLEPLLERVFNESGLAKSLQAGASAEEGALDNINELINAAAHYDRNAEQPSVIDYLQQISLFSDTDAYDPSGQRVALMTLHAAKGLEFDNVFIAGLEEGLLPHERSNSGERQDDIEEERRLLFVGMTRARASLQISYSRYRTIRGQTVRTIPSQFLFELGCQVSPSATDSETEGPPNAHASQSARRFVKGQLVRHKSFGLGRVKEFIDMGENSIVVVKFNTGPTKSLMVKYAGLSEAPSR
jgi:DNA helicase-2/ATP-dependent DNA helicase PcrA